jgi:hypothetical protein
MAEEKRICPTCGGAGYLYNEETYTREPCNCKVAEYMFKHLGTEIARAETIFTSPLFEFGDNAGDPPKLDRTKESLHIKSPWTVLLPHLKLCLGTKGIFFEFRIVTDEKIKTVFVGAESYAARAKSKRDDMVTFNSLSDLLGPEFPFVIIRIGFLGHKNIAAPGAVKEALMLRDAAQKPTWIVADPDASPFGPGNFTYSDDLAEYIDRNFKTVSLSRSADTRAYVPRGYEGAEEVVGGVEDVSTSAPMTTGTRPARRPTTVPSSSISVDEDFAALEGKPKFKGKSSYKKSGGGPI